MMQEIGQFISTVGFPVAVASYLLWRMNGKMDRLTQAIHKLIKHLEESEEETAHRLMQRRRK